MLLSSSGAGLHKPKDQSHGILGLKESIALALFSFVSGILTPPTLRITCKSTSSFLNDHYFCPRSNLNLGNKSRSIIDISSSPQKAINQTIIENSTQNDKKRNDNTITTQMNRTCSEDDLNNFLHLSSTKVPGFHVICFETESNSNNNVNSMTIYKEGNILSKVEQEMTGDLASFSWETLKEHLFEILTPFSNSNNDSRWAIFDLQGKLIINFQKEQQMLQRSKPKNLDLLIHHQIIQSNNMVLFIEGGTWFWPGIQIGFERTINLSSADTNTNHHPERNITLETISMDPLIVSVKGFLTVDECHYLQQKSEPRVTRASDVTLMDSDKGKAAAEWRTSQSTFISAKNDVKLLELERRTASLTRIPKDHQEDMQVLKYSKGQKYDAHMDYFDTKLYRNDLSIQSLTQKGKRNRFATVFWYLSDVTKGGETIFPMFNKQPYPKNLADCSKGLKVKPEIGKVIIFYSLYPNGENNKHSLHGACPVEEGIKWAANKWIWNSPMPFISP